MSPKDLISVGSSCLDAKMYREAEYWFSQLLPLSIMADKKYFSDISTATGKYATALYRNGKLDKAVEILQKRLSEDATNKELLLDLSMYMTEQFNSGRTGRNQKANTESQYMNEQYETLCRKEDVLVSNESLNLKCFIKSTAIPLFTAKVEIFHDDPPLWMFHDVVSNHEIEWLKQKASVNISRSLLGSSDRTGLGASEARISQQAWIFDNYQVSLKLSQRIALYTGLDLKIKPVTTNAEGFQVLNYGTGGLYGVHVDSVRDYRDMGYEAGSMLFNSGDRLATWMFYLSDVEYGGATVFPVIQTKVPVTKGAAAFWYNLKRNGEIDYRTIHAGCPVVLGDKWVANKWIREVGQTFLYPCSLNEND